MKGLRKRILMIVMLMVLVGLSAEAMAATYSIGSLSEFKAFRDGFNSGAISLGAGDVVELTANIDMKNETWIPIGTSDKYFRGEFDGNGYTISNMKVQNAGSLAQVGLFALVEKSYIHDVNFKNVTLIGNGDNLRMGVISGNLQYWNVVENVNISNVKITVNGNGGLIGTTAGYVWKSQYGNVHVKNTEITVTGSESVVGGMVAYGRAHVWDTGVVGNNQYWLDGTVKNSEGTDYVLQNYFTDCSVTGADISISGGAEVGGFIGGDTYNSHSNFFKDCVVSDLDMDCKNGTYSAGGFMGYKNGTTEALGVVPFDGCSAQGTINGDKGNYGGFVGYVGGRAASFENAHADVDVVSDGIAGGFVGTTAQYFTHKESFINCTADGDVQGTSAGGFVGMITLGGDGDNLNIELDGCAANGNVSGDNVGGLIGEIKLELPATNWSTVEGTGIVEITNSSANGTVSGGNNVGSLIGLVQNIATRETTPDAIAEIKGDRVAVSNNQLPMYNSTQQNTNENAISIAQGYQIVYKLNGGKDSGNPKAYAAGDTIKLKDPTREGYIFLGWTGANGSRPQADLTITLASGEIQFVANWKQILAPGMLPQTGDESIPMIYLLTVLGCAAAGAYLIKRRALR